MTTYQIDLGQPKLTCKIQGLDHEIVITSQKTNKKYIKAQFLNNSMLKNEIEI